MAVTQPPLTVAELATTGGPAAGYIDAHADAWTSTLLDSFGG